MIKEPGGVKDTKESGFLKLKQELESDEENSKSDFDSDSDNIFGKGAAENEKDNKSSSKYSEDEDIDLDELDKRHQNKFLSQKRNKPQRESILFMLHFTKSVSWLSDEWLDCQGTC